MNIVFTRKSKGHPSSQHGTNNMKLKTLIKLIIKWVMGTFQRRFSNTFSSNRSNLNVILHYVYMYISLKWNYCSNFSRFCGKIWFYWLHVCVLSLCNYSYEFGDWQIILKVDMLRMDQGTIVTCWNWSSGFREEFLWADRLRLGFSCLQ